MPSETDGKPSPFEDIQSNILLAFEFTKGLAESEFHKDLRTVYAVTRCLEIISEASRRLPASFKTRHKHIAWVDVAGAGNVYRHDYGSVSTSRIWATVNVLQPLLVAVEEELATRRTKPDTG